MIAALFLIDLFCLILVALKKQNMAFSLLIINLLFCFLMLLHHTTDLFNIQ